jgi:hypothetical protein
MASFNFVEPYLRALFGFLGVVDVTFLTAGGTMSLSRGQDRDAFLAPHLQAVQTHAQLSSLSLQASFVASSSAILRENDGLGARVSQNP